jgi:hypothetical protein
VLPRAPLAWAAWNYERAADRQREQAAVCLHYLINRLQPLPWQQPVVVSLNPQREPIDPAQVIGEYDYSHPVFDPPPSPRRPAAADPGPVAPVVLRRLDTLRLPRGRPDVGAGGGRRGLRARAALPVRRGGMNAQALIGIGEVRHRRLRPAANAFAYPTYFLLLPMRSLRERPVPALARNRFGLLASTTATMATAAPTRWPGSTNCCSRRRACRRRRARSGCTPTRACWAMSSSRSASGTATARRLAGGHRGRGQQHLRRAPLLPAGGPGLAWGRELRRARSSTCRRSASVEGSYRFRFMRTADRTVARIDHDDDEGPLLQTSVSGHLQPLTRTPARRAFFGMPLMTPGRDRPHPLAGAALWLKRVPFFSKPAPPEAFTTR